MNLNRIDLNLFVVFDAIYAEANLTRASEILNVTQPAVSNALARLRDTFDDPLFVRAGRAMVPTPVAQNLIGPVRSALAQLQDSVDARRSFDPATADKTFNIAIRDISSSLLMPDLVPLLHQRAPHVRLHCHQVERRDIAGELAAATLDFAVDIPGLGKARLHSRKLHQDRYVCILRRDHPMARGRLTLKRYLDMEHVMVSSRRHGRSYTELALARSGEQANTVLRLQHYQPAFHVVLGSNLALAAPRSLAAWYDVVVRELPFEVAPLDSLLYWHRNADHDPANIWMRDLMAEASRRPDRNAA